MGCLFLRIEDLRLVSVVVRVSWKFHCLASLTIPPIPYAISRGALLTPQALFRPSRNHNHSFQASQSELDPRFLGHDINQSIFHLLIWTNNKINGEHLELARAQAPA